MMRVEGNHLFAYFKQRRNILRQSSKMSMRKGNRRNQVLIFLLEIALIFGELWECYGHHDKSKMSSSFHAGCLTTMRGRCYPIPARYMKNLNKRRKEYGLTTSGFAGYLVGLNDKAIIKHVQRQASWAKIGRRRDLLSKRNTFARSKVSAAHVDGNKALQRMTKWERVLYLKSAKRIAARESRLSLAMDATNVSFGKVMNATFFFLEQSKACGCLQWIVFFIIFSDGLNR